MLYPETGIEKDSSMRLYG